MTFARILRSVRWDELIMLLRLALPVFGHLDDDLYPTFVGDTVGKQLADGGCERIFRAHVEGRRIFWA